jgi:hypothetical protein
MKKIAGGCALLFLVLAGCIVTGRDFPSAAVNRITKGQTTQTEILATFGQPYMKIDDGGAVTWTYYRELRGLPNRYQTKELRVVFDEHQVVVNYTFTINYPDEARQP